jgi:NAD(P)-dependent dehydrogenase (short-subunit alcohol dehydrogenase family)
MVYVCSPRSYTAAMSPIALVTGANRGIGLEVCKQLAARGYSVLLGSRDFIKGAQAAAPMQRAGLDVTALVLDVADPGSIKAAAQVVSAQHGQLDVLINNAAILYDSWQQAANADIASVQQAFETNTLGPLRMTQAFLPLLRKSTCARIVNVSSEAASLASMSGGTPAYGASKAALNALTRKLAAELSAERILVNAICPGWTATEMGGAGGRPVADGAAGIVWAATLPDDGPSGGFYRDQQPLAW